MKKIFISMLTLTALSISTAKATEMPELAIKSGCSACHAVDKKIIGPAWIDVALRYSSNDQARLIEKVKKGGKGNWTSVTGGIAMPAYSPRVSDKDIKTLVEFILQLK